MELSEEHISGMLENIPTFSQSVIRILELTSNLDSSSKDLVDQIVHDPILTSKVLRLVNSAYFGLSREVNSIQQCVVYVGINTIKNLAISVAAMGSLPKTNRAGLDMSNFWLHSLVTAVVAKLIAQKIGIPKTEVSIYFISGLLHDIGQIIFSQTQPEAYREVIALVQSQQRPLHEVEQEAFGINHSELGALLAEKWNLPQAMADAIRSHHDPAKADAEQLMNRTILVASQVAKSLGEEDSQFAAIGEIPDFVEPWLGAPFAKIAESLPNIEDEINSARVFIQMSN